MFRKAEFRFLSVIFLVSLLFGCSTKKDAFLNRNWHGLNTRYNVLYNGINAFEAGREQLRQEYRDNYWDILPVERLAVSGDLKLDSESNTPEFLRAEEKATKAIQKHSMEIDFEERNPQTDEAFLLLGKARYFDERYVPALEAFNYILRKYPESNKLNEATIWREKTNLRLGYDEMALKNLKRLLLYEKLSNQEYADARSVMGQAYLNLNIPDTAIMQLKTAAAYTRFKEEEARYLFIVGQLYNQLGHRDSASMAFEKVIAFNRKIPRTYLINAHLQVIRNIPQTIENELYLFQYLTDLKENRENRPFLDKILRSLAEFHLIAGEDSLALNYYTQSTQYSDNDPIISALNYEDLANYHFDHSNYPIAGAYYDSVLTNLEENTRKHRYIKKKRTNLDEVIRLERIAQITDSTLYLVDLDPIAQKIYFQNYVDSLKTADMAAALSEDSKEKLPVKASPLGGGRTGTGTFYFYNPASLEQGKVSFISVWGNRILEDNWRRGRSSAVVGLAENTTELPELSNEAQEQDSGNRYNAEYYLSLIPSDAFVVDSLRRERNLANYQLGLLYKEKLKEQELAISKLEKALENNPEEALELPIRYNLYRLYQETGNLRANEMRNVLLQKFPDSRYVSILNNSEMATGSTEQGPEAEYRKLLSTFENKDFEAVINEIEKIVIKYPGDPAIPKFELLKSNAIGRIRGFIAFKSSLQELVMDYPNSPEANRAKIILEEQLPKMESNDFVDLNKDNIQGNWKVVFPLSVADDKQADDLIKILNQSMKDLGYRYKVSKDVFTASDNFVVVHGFPSEAYAMGYAELMRNNSQYRITLESFVIFSEHYKTVQIHKNLSEYRNYKSPQISENND